MQLRISALSVALCIAIVAPTVMAKDGTYTATKLGRNGDVTLQVAIENDRIKTSKFKAGPKRIRSPISPHTGTRRHCEVSDDQC